MGVGRGGVTPGSGISSETSGMINKTKKKKKITTFLKKVNSFEHLPNMPKDQEFHL